MRSRRQYFCDHPAVLAHRVFRRCLVRQDSRHELRRVCLSIGVRRLHRFMRSDFAAPHRQSQAGHHPREPNLGAIGGGIWAEAGLAKTASDRFLPGVKKSSWFGMMAVAQRPAPRSQGGRFDDTACQL